MTPKPKRTPTTFSSLPREIRDEICAHLFTTNVASASNTFSTLHGIKTEDDSTLKQILVVLNAWLERSHIAYEICTALYRHSTFHHRDPLTPMAKFLRSTALLPPEDNLKYHPRAAQQRRFTNEAFLTNISISISAPLHSEPETGPGSVLFHLLRCPRLRSLTVHLETSASSVRARDGGEDGRMSASPLSEIAHACEKLQKAAGGRLRLVVRVDEAFCTGRALDEFDRRGVVWCVGGEGRGKGLGIVSTGGCGKGGKLGMRKEYGRMNHVRLLRESGC